MALGRIGWESWLRAAGWWDRFPPRERPPFGHGAEAVLPDRTVLVTSFHPSRQNTNTGRLTREMWSGVFEGIGGRTEAVEDGASSRADSDVSRPGREPRSHTLGRGFFACVSDD